MDSRASCLQVSSRDATGSTWVVNKRCTSCRAVSRSSGLWSPPRVRQYADSPVPTATRLPASTSDSTSGRSPNMPSSPAMLLAKVADRKSRCGTSVRPPAAKALSSTWSFRKSVHLKVTFMPLLSTSSVAPSPGSSVRDTMAPAGDRSSTRRAGASSKGQGGTAPAASAASTSATTAFSAASSSQLLWATVLTTQERSVPQEEAMRCRSPAVTRGSSVLDMRASMSAPTTNSPCRKWRMYSSRMSGAYV
mmetsp:Transcript_3674/g.10648  ORF Transcript_3674/g.10648 Transcript_3674/m.10648 type:complete len:249 (+) Transcript_3674:2577-3323(+)